MSDFAARVEALPLLGVGLGYRRPLRRLFRDPTAPLECIEVVAEHFFGARAPKRPRLFGERPVMVHSLDASLGTPGPLDEAYLEQVATVAEGLGAVLVSDHLAVTRTGQVELGHLNPVPPLAKYVGPIAAKIRAIQERTGLPFLLENITTHLRLKGDLPFAEFYNRICAEADCGMLLDVTNLFVNCRNFERDPLAALEQLELSRVVQLHIVGYTERDGRLYDSHRAEIQEPLYAFTEQVLQRAPVRAIVVERDGHYPRDAVLFEQLTRLRQLFALAVRP